MSMPVVECEHGIRQYARRGVEPFACRCRIDQSLGIRQLPRLEVKNRPVDWPWLYGGGRDGVK
jgi:hypothetical protein